MDDSDEVFDEFDDFDDPSDEVGPPLFKDEEKFAQDQAMHGVYLVLIPLFLICNPITLGIFWLWFLNNVIPPEGRLWGYLLSPVILGISAVIIGVLTSLIKTDDENAKANANANANANAKAKKYKSRSKKVQSKKKK